jgi:hypothetical protein
MATLLVDFHGRRQKTAHWASARKFSKVLAGDYGLELRTTFVGDSSRPSRAISVAGEFQ